MILKKLSMVAVMAAALGTFGCKSDCEKFCEETLECDPDDSPFVQQEDDCSDDCSEEEELIDAADCGDLADDLYACLDGLDVCDSEDVADCSEEYEDLSECLSDYCDLPDLPDNNDIADLPGECD